MIHVRTQCFAEGSEIAIKFHREAIVLKNHNPDFQAFV